MKLASVFFDDTVCIPGAKDVGGGVYQDLRDSSFHAADGWDIDWDGHVLFTLWREGMTAHAQVGGYGFSFVAESAGGGPDSPRYSEPATAPVEPAPSPKRRRK